MIFTSYFANVRNIKNKQLVSISRYSPDWLTNAIEAKELAPSAKLLNDYKNGLVSDLEYDKIYKEETLSKLNPKEIYSKYNDSVFLCYEKRGDFCHRNIVSEWLMENGFDSKEIEPVKVAIIGSRSFNDYETFSFIINKFIEKNPQVEIVSGGANGADFLAKKFALENNIKIKEFLADWENKDKSAGFIRNKDIWDYSDIGIAFWDGKSKGTEHSFMLSYKQNKKCFIFNFNKNCFVPRVIKGDILKSNAEVIAFTANSITKKTGELVMSASCAKVFKESFNGIDKEFGGINSKFGWKVIDFNGKKIGAFQSKIHYKDKSTLNIIKYSIEQLKKDIKNYDSVALCFPGVLNGGLKRGDVLPLFDGLSLDLFVEN